MAGHFDGGNVFQLLDVGCAPDQRDCHVGSTRVAMQYKVTRLFDRVLFRVRRHQNAGSMCVVLKDMT